MDFIEEYDPTNFEIKKLNNKSTKMIFDDSLTIKKINQFACNKGIVSFIDMRNSQIEIIDDAAFYECFLLQEILFPKTLKIINSNAFYGTKLINISIPSLVERMTGFAWNQIPTIEYFDVDEGNKHFSSYKGFLFNKDKTELICTPRNIKNEEGIPLIYQIKSINEYALTSTQLLSFTCPSNIHIIATRVFHAIPGIITIDLTISQITIIPADLIFAGCFNLKVVKLPFALKTISQNAFNLVETLETIFIYPYVETIENNSFNDCPSLKAIIYYGNNNFSMNSIFTGTIDKNKLKIQVTRMYQYQTFGTIPVRKEKMSFIKTNNQATNYHQLNSFLFTYILHKTS